MTSNSTFQIVICSDMACIVGVCEGKVYVDLVFVHVYICMCMWFVFMYMYFASRLINVLFMQFVLHASTLHFLDFNESFCIS